MQPGIGCLSEPVVTARVQLRTVYFAPAVQAKMVLGGPARNRRLIKGCSCTEASMRVSEHEALPRPTQAEMTSAIALMLQEASVLCGATSSRLLIKTASCTDASMWVCNLKTCLNSMYATCMLQEALHLWYTYDKGDIPPTLHICYRRHSIYVAYMLQETSHLNVHICDRRYSTYVAYVLQEKMVLGGAARNRRHSTYITCM